MNIFLFNCTFSGRSIILGSGLDTPLFFDSSTAFGTERDTEFITKESGRNISRVCVAR